MARRHADLRNAFSRGALDPELWERIDLEHYYLALRENLNCVVGAKGGLKNRPGTVLPSQNRLRRCLAPIPLQASMVTVFNGGAPANLVDQSPTTYFTTSAVAGPTFIVCEVDLGASVAVVACDLVNFYSGTSGVTASATTGLAVEYWDGAAWRSMAAPSSADQIQRVAIRTTSRTRRFAPPPGTVRTARNWRVVAHNAAGVGAINVGSLVFWKEREAISPVRYFPFARNSENVYQLVLTDRNIDVFKNGEYCASVPVPVGAEFIADVQLTQSIDTALLFHQEVFTQKITRQGSDTEWNTENVALTNVPALSANTAFSSNQDEIQRLEISGLTVGDTFALFFGGLWVAPIAAGATAADTATSIQTALRAHSAVGADVFVSVVSSTPLVIGVIFTNTNGSRRWPPLSFVPLSGAATCITRSVQKGLASTAAIFGDTTGFPRTGLFHQGRLFLGGFRSAPSTLLVSRAGNLWDFLTTGNPMTADLGIEKTITSQEVEEIISVFVGQRMFVFTSRAEWWFESAAFDATKTNDLTVATDYGIARNIAPMLVQGGTLFVQSGGQNGEAENVVVRDLRYLYDQNNFSAEPLTLLGGHLLTNVTRCAKRNGVTTKDASLLFFVNAAGDFVVLTYLKTQELIAMAPAVTAGAVRDIGVDVLRNAWLIVERTAAGVADNYLERFDDNTFLDAAVSKAGPISTFTGLAHLEGQSVWALVDGDVQGPFVVVGGAVTLTTPATTTATVGLFAPVAIRTLPFRPKLQVQEPFRKLCRVVDVELSLLGSGPLALSANDGEFMELPMRHFDGGPLPAEASGEEPTNDFLDVPMMNRLYSGYARLSGLDGWTRFGDIRITQPVPGPFYIRAVRLEVAY